MARNGELELNRRGLTWLFVPSATRRYAAMPVPPVSSGNVAIDVKSKPGTIESCVMGPWMLPPSLSVNAAALPAAFLICRGSPVSSFR